VYLSKFYEACQEVPGVIYVTVTEFRRGDAPAGSVEQHGTIVLEQNEIPVLPDADGYRDGLTVVLVPGPR
jgi:hypothetical protein